MREATQPDARPQAEKALVHQPDPVLAVRTRVATHPEPRADTRKLPGLDGLRAVAVSLVLFAHFCPRFSAKPTLDRLVEQGGFGVEIFFVLSGFLITHLLIREEQTSGNISIRLFYLRRALRILPPLLAFLAFLALASALGAVNVPAIDMISGLFFLRNYIGTSLETGHLWSLAIEEQFYLIWPISLVFIGSVRWRLYLTAALVCLLPFWQNLSFRLAGGAQAVNGWRTDLRMEPLAIGALLALLLAVPTTRSLLTHRFVQGPWPAAGALIFLCLALLTNALDVPVLRAFLPTMMWLCVAVAINCSIHGRDSLLTTVLETKPLVWLGTLSYSLYLWQQPFAPRLPHVPTTWFRTFPVDLLLALFLATCSYYIIERPFLSLRGRLRREPKSRPARQQAF